MREYSPLEPATFKCHGMQIDYHTSLGISLETYLFHSLYKCHLSMHPESKTNVFKDLDLCIPRPWPLYIYSRGPKIPISKWILCSLLLWPVKYSLSSSICENLFGIAHNLLRQWQQTWVRALLSNMWPVSWFCLTHQSTRCCIPKHGGEETECGAKSKHLIQQL